MSKMRPQNTGLQTRSAQARDEEADACELLLAELRKSPAVLRLSYVADTENAALVNQRVEAVKRQLTEAWDASKNNYMLNIEPEIFWRRGAPSKRHDVRVPGSK